VRTNRRRELLAEYIDIGHIIIIKLLILNDRFLNLAAVEIFFNETTFAYHIFYAFKS